MLFAAKCTLCYVFFCFYFQLFPNKSIFCCFTQEKSHAFDVVEVFGTLLLKPFQQISIRFSQ